LLLVAFPLGAARPLAAQKTGDQSRLVFTVSAGYAFGRDLWSVGAQPLILDETSLLALDRNLEGTWQAELGVTYFRSPNLGFTFDLGFIDINTKDTCRVLNPNSGSIDGPAVCGSINNTGTSALSTALSVGVILRAATRQKVSPFLRLQGGLFIVNRSTIELTGNYINVDLEPVYVPIYPSDGSSSVSAEFAVGAGVTIPVSKAYHLRLEGRGTTFGLPVVTGPTDFQGVIPPTETRYLTQWSILVGIDLVLERKHGRRY
jgi:hypothetical protein